MERRQISEKRDRAKDMSPGDPLDLLKGISDLFVSYEPNFGFENTIEFESNKRSKLLHINFCDFSWLELIKSQYTE